MNLTPRTIGLLVLLIFCLFMGVTAISMGFGALFPSMNLVAQPFVCPDGTMESSTEVYRPYPGKTVTSITWYCADETTATRTQLSLLPISLIAGLMYGLGLYLIVLGLFWLRQRRNNITSGPGMPRF